MKLQTFYLWILILCGLNLVSCDPECPPSISMYCTGRVLDNPESQRPIAEAVLKPEVYYWIEKGNGFPHSSGWRIPYTGSEWCEWKQQWCVFLADSQGRWGREISAHPTKLRLTVFYLDKDSVEHRFTTQEYEYKNKLSWQNIIIYVSDYE